MSPMNMTLAEYLERAGQKRWKWGEVDCGQFGLGWVRERTGQPLPALFDYSSQDDLLAALQANGGLAAVVSRWMETNGFRPTLDPDDGDIGLAPIRERRGARLSPIEGLAPVAIVIRFGARWISQESRGIGGLEFEGIPAWRIA